MATRVFLHAGTMKSGSTYLQSLWWQNRDALVERGLLLPGTRLADHFHAAAVVSDQTRVVDDMSRRDRRSWPRLVDEVGRWDRTALISHEVFSPASAGRAADALRRLEGVADEVHLLLTLRDLARQLPSHWQQAVKRQSASTLRAYCERVRADPDHRFWQYHDVPALLDRWSQGLPPDRVHLVVIPRRPPRDWLWQSTLELLGVDPAGLAAVPRGANESLGVVEVELMRRIQQALPAEERGLATERVAKGFFARKVVAAAGDGEAWVMPADLHEWAVERGAAMADGLRGRGHHVIGDLDDLLPPPEPPTGRTPEDVTDAELAATATRALARSLVHERDHRATLARLRARVRRQS